MSIPFRKQVESLTAQRNRLRRELNESRSAYTQALRREDEGKQARQRLLDRAEALQESCNKARDQNLDLRNKYHYSLYWFIVILFISHALAGVGWLLLL